MLKTFNCGIGMCLVVDKTKSEDIINQLNLCDVTSGIWSGEIGRIVERKEGQGQVKVENFMEALGRENFLVSCLSLFGSNLMYIFCLIW